MMKALFSGVAGLKSHQTQMDVIGNNIANVNTYGFKASRVTFRDVYYQTLSAGSGGGAIPADPETAPAALGGTNPTQIGYGSLVASVDVNPTRSGMAATGLGYDCYIAGEGYFVVQNGKDDYLYTRVGAFNFDNQGFLVDGNGRKVCGVNADPDATPDTDGNLPELVLTDSPEPIQIPVDSLGKLINITFGPDGVITGENKETGSIETIGLIGLANIPNPHGLAQEGNSYYKATKNSGDVTFEAPGAIATGTLVTSALESSNVDLANEFAQMITTQRGFQANSRIITVGDEMLETLINMKR